MRHKVSRQYCFALVFLLTGVLVLAASIGLAAKKGGKPQWEWTVAISDEIEHDNRLHLYSDGEEYRDEENGVSVRVYRERQRAYRFLLRIKQGSARQIALRNIELVDASVDPSEGPGYFPDDLFDCEYNPLLCDINEPYTCRLEDFLNRFHPYCDYDWIYINITVSLDIEGMTLHEVQTLENEFVGINIRWTDDSFGYPDEGFHNMDAQNLPAPIGGHSDRFSELYIERTDVDTWKIWVDYPDPYLDYAEFYYGFFHGRRGGNQKYSIAADGPFNFQMTWTRTQVVN